MRSFLGRDILSLKEFERNEFERVFEVCDELAPIARKRRNIDLLADKTLLTAFYQPAREPGCRPRPRCTGWAATCSGSPTRR